MENPPSPTLYVRNLNEKVKKDELRRSLYYLFSQFGPVLDVVALKTQKMRGQAFVVFRDIASATNALRSMVNFNFFDKPLRLAYAKTKSEALCKFLGETPGSKPMEKKSNREKRKATDEAGKAAKRVAKPSGGATSSSSAAAAAPAAVATSAAPSKAAPEKPNKILFCTNLPEETNEMMLEMLFKQFPGFKEVRLVEGRSDIAFIEFGADAESTTARDALQGFKITPTHQMKIEYAKK